MEYRDLVLCVPTNEVYNRIQTIYDDLGMIDYSTPLRAMCPHRYEWLLEHIYQHDEVINMLTAEGFFITQEQFKNQINLKSKQVKLLIEYNELEKLIDKERKEV